MKLSESLSALMDSECDDLERRRLIEALISDPTLQQQWSALHETRAAMRGEPPLVDSFAMLARVREGLTADLPHESAVEPAASGATKPGLRIPRSWRASAIGLSAAAGFALVTYLGIGRESGVSGGGPAVAQGAMSVALPVADAQLMVREQRQRAYMLRHVQQTTMAGTAAMPLVRLAAFQSRE